MPIAAVFVIAVVVADGGAAHVRRGSLIAGFQVGFTLLSLLTRHQSALYPVAVALALLSTTVLILFATYCVMRYVLRARAEPGVRVVRASISPDNAGSLATIAGFGFVEVGEQWDEQDGLELVFELAV